MTTARDPQRPAGAYASTTHTAVRAARLSETVIQPRRAVVEYSRGFNQLPYRVIHDAQAHPPYGLYRIYVGERLIGSQLSYPTADDCRNVFARAP